MLRNWQRMNILGRGAFGNIYSASRIGTDEIFALKIVEFNSENSVHMKEMKDLENEITQLSSLDHPRIVKYFGFERDERSICIVMEHMPGGSLKDEINANRALKEVVARKFSLQILEGLLHLHTCNKIHRDIKCGNILLDSSKKNVKIADFGTCKHMPTLRSRAPKTYVESTYFMAPEIMLGEKYGPKADIWSLGCTIVEMLTGSPPWKNLEPVAAIFLIGTSKTKPIYTLPDEISPKFCGFLDLLFTRDPTDRPSSEEALCQFYLAFPKSEEVSEEPEAFITFSPESLIPEKFKRSPSRSPRMPRLNSSPKVSKQETSLLRKTKAISLEVPSESESDQGHKNELDLKTLLTVSDGFYSELPLITSLPDSVQLKPTSPMLVFHRCPEESIVQVIRAVHRETRKSLDIELLECSIGKRLPAMYACCHSIDFNSCIVGSLLSEILSSNSIVQGLGFFGSTKFRKDISLQNGINIECSRKRTYNRIVIDLTETDAPFLAQIEALAKPKILELYNGAFDDTLITELCHNAQSFKQLSFYLCDLTKLSSDSLTLIAKNLQTRCLFFVFCNVGPTISSLFENTRLTRTLFIWSSSLIQSNFLLSNLSVIPSLHCLEITINGYPFHQAQADSSVFKMDLDTLKVIFTMMNLVTRDQLLCLAKKCKISFSTIQYWYNICSSIDANRTFTREEFRRLLAYLKDVKLRRLEIRVGGDFTFQQSDIQSFLLNSSIKHLYIEPCFFPKSEVNYISAGVHLWRLNWEPTDDGGLHFYN